MERKYGTAVCDICGKTFKKKRIDQKRCSKECTAEQRRKVARERHDRVKKEMEAEQKPVKKMDRCTRKSCRYHPGRNDGVGPSCDYCYTTGKSRGCSIAECEIYKHEKKTKGGNRKCITISQ